MISALEAAVAGSLSRWHQDRTRPLGVKDPATGDDSWPIEFERRRRADGRTLWHYTMPPEVADIVLRGT